MTSEAGVKLLQNAFRASGRTRDVRVKEGGSVSHEVAALARRAMLGGLRFDESFSPSRGDELRDLQPFYGNQALQSLLSQGDFGPRTAGGCSCGGACTKCSGGEEAAHAEGPHRTCSLVSGSMGRDEEEEKTGATPGRCSESSSCELDEETQPTRRAERQPHNNDATIVCDGSGGYRPDLRGWTGARCGVEDCVRRHEQSHANDWAKRYPDGCKNADGTPKPNGSQIPLSGPGYDDFLKKSECDAYTTEIPCEESALNNAGTADCKTYVKGVLDDSKKQQQAYCSGGC